MAGSARAALAGMVLATALWGATFVVVRDSLGSIAPGPLTFARFTASAVVFAPLLWLRRRRIGRDTLAGGAVAGVLAAAGYLLQAIGLTTTSAGSSAFLTSAGTLAAALFAWPLLAQRPTRLLAAGLLLALAGSALLSLGAGFRIGRGELWTLGGAACYALQVVVLGRVAPAGDAIALTGIQSIAMSLVLSPWAREAARQLAALDAAGVARFVYLALCGSVIAPLLQVLAQRALPPGRIGLLFALEPVFAVLFALTAGAERYPLRWWAGAALIAGAVLLVESRSLRAPASSPPATR
ncbi:MAG TPA: DMT family transporter [Candidatus Eisenbacteria bacterium]|jgi:drug/metabolite transporter (DMT)-like permease